MSVIAIDGISWLRDLYVTSVTKRVATVFVQTHDPPALYNVDSRYTTWKWCLHSPYRWIHSVILSLCRESGPLSQTRSSFNFFFFLFSRRTVVRLSTSVCSVGLHAEDWRLCSSVNDSCGPVNAVWSVKLGLIKSRVCSSEPGATMQRQKRFVLAEIQSEEQEWHLLAYVYIHVWFKF